MDSPKWDWGAGFCKSHPGNDLPCKVCVETLDSALLRDEIVDGMISTWLAGFVFRIPYTHAEVKAAEKKWHAGHYKCPPFPAIWTDKDSRTWERNAAGEVREVTDLIVKEQRAVSQSQTFAAVYGLLGEPPKLVVNKDGTFRRGNVSGIVISGEDTGMEIFDESSIIKIPINVKIIHTVNNGVSQANAEAMEMQKPDDAGLLYGTARPFGWMNKEQIEKIMEGVEPYKMADTPGFPPGVAVTNEVDFPNMSLTNPPRVNMLTVTQEEMDRDNSPLTTKGHPIHDAKIDAEGKFKVELVRDDKIIESHESTNKIVTGGFNALMSVDNRIRSGSFFLPSNEATGEEVKMAEESFRGPKHLGGGITEEKRMLRNVSLTQRLERRARSWGAVFSNRKTVGGELFQLCHRQEFPIDFDGLPEMMKSSLAEALEERLVELISTIGERVCLELLRVGMSRDFVNGLVERAKSNPKPDR